MLENRKDVTINTEHFSCPELRLKSKHEIIENHNILFHKKIIL